MASFAHLVFTPWPQIAAAIFTPQFLSHLAILGPSVKRGPVMAEIGEPERKVRREREDQPAPAMPQPVTVPESVPVNS